MFNKVVLMGRMVADPELTYTPSNVSLCRFRIAVDRSFVKKGEERQADFFEITAWRHTAEFICKHFGKGRMIHVEGILQNNNYTDKNGVKRYTNAIIAERISFCGDKRADGQNVQNVSPTVPEFATAVPSAPSVQQMPPGNFGDFEEILSDGNVPF